MNMKINFKSLPVLSLGLGLLTCVIRVALLTLGRDGKGLLTVWHPLNVLAWAVTAVAVALVILGVWKLDGSRKYEHNFAPSLAAALGCCLLAGGIAASVVSGLGSWTRMTGICSLCGLLTVPALALAGLNRKQGKRPFFGFHAIVWLYLALCAVSRYQIWSSRPQMQNWFFNMAALLMLTVFAYYQTAFDENMGNRRMLLGSGLLAAFFCVAAMANGEDVLLYLTGAVWAVTNLCSLTPVKRRRRNPVTEEAQEDAE